jgi:hypothetical protein
MKRIAPALLASFALVGYVQAQAPAQTPAPAPASAAAPASDGSDSLGRACKKEVKDLCGRAHGQEMQDCVKSGLDMNKFSADCKAKLAKPPAKPSS